MRHSASMSSADDVTQMDFPGINTWILCILLLFGTTFNVLIEHYTATKQKWNNSIHSQKETNWQSCSKIFYETFICTQANLLSDMTFITALRWRRNESDSVSNHQPNDCLLNRLFRRGSQKTSKLRVTGLCAGNSPGTGEFPAQMASNAEIVSIWWRHHGILSSIKNRDVECRVMY